jgi:hypothetical protein
MPPTLYSDCPPASLIKQLAAMLYDSLLIFAVLFFATAIVIIFNQGEAIESSLWFSLYLLLTLFTFYTWFWKQSGLGQLLPALGIRFAFVTLFRSRVLVAIFQTVYLA